MANGYVAELFGYLPLDRSCKGFLWGLCSCRQYNVIYAALDQIWHLYPLRLRAQNNRRTRNMVNFVGEHRIVGGD